MRRLGRLILGAVLATTVAACAPTSPTAQTAGPCAVTSPTAERTVPPPQPTGPNEGMVFTPGPREFLYGNDALLVLLPNDGVLRPSDPQRGLSGGLKLPWWRVARGNLAVTTKRLDGSTPPRTPDVPGGYGDTGFQPAGIYFDAPGCWQIIGTLGAQTLAFVVIVVER